MKYLFLLVFAVSSIVHLYASVKKNKKLRAATKPFILIGLFVYYCFAAEPVRPIVLAAIFFSWLGDVLLIPEGVKWFTAGGISFMVSHLCFACAYMRRVDFSVIPLWAVLLIAAVYAVAVTLVFKGLRPHLPKGLFWPMMLYLFINGINNCTALYQLISLPCHATAVIYLGAILFFCSDSILFYVRFKKDTRWKSHFPVMLTYILAELLIVYGLMAVG